MATQTVTANRSTQDLPPEQKVRAVQEAFADAPDAGKVALKNILKDLKSELASRTGVRTESAGRIGLRNGKVSELTLIAPFAPGGAERLRTVLNMLDGDFRGAEKVGTVHDMRFVFLDNDTKMLFATAYDGDFDPYIDDFGTKIPDYMDVVFTAFEGWPGIRSPQIKDWIAAHMVPAAAWYVASPNLTVADTRRLEKVGKAVDELLDKVA
ncbi:hypothetical protein RFM26_28305 [Mesorhizobium sp. VK23B]|uniref:Uncharacterized protein n=1 Tax=Mesorhizobium dulcispinae TaxID=3072316 RepID=A0ABU4XML0_9HYPH|nr:MULTISPECIES: hypothetical protein [unclassified Mesorhizobium]MDX8469604.1 hypothetical protein [Mesorhizobium sp. VK23B]MDX8475979.1 hypothetical protein [Mesorhizobium sp. VK23A]